MDEPDVTMSQAVHAPSKTPQAHLASGEGTRRGKTFNDCVWGHIYLDGMVCDVIDTPAFQRLRDLKQLGCAYLIFPGASHNRFEHSLGTCHLANETFDLIAQTQRHELGLERGDRNVVSLAGLCHDLGHGPFSHVFDHEFLPRALGSHYESCGWSHEKMSGDLLEHLVDEGSIDLDGGIAAAGDTLRRVRSLITASCRDRPSSLEAANQKGFLQDIVANGRNSVDVDKYDYINRDSRSCGLTPSCDVKRLMRFMKVIGDEICFKASEVHGLYELFHSRASLHQRVYTHKKGKAVEYMLVDILVEADMALGRAISNSISDPAAFMQMDDTILKRVEWSTDPGMKKAQTLLESLRRRDLYKWVNEYTVPAERLREYKKVTAEEVAACQGDNGIPGGIRPDQIIVQNLKIDWAMGGKNPVDSVHFFGDYDSTEKFLIPKEKVSTLIPETFMERKVRVFAKGNDPDLIEAVAEAFVNYQRRISISGQVFSTPVKKIRKRTFATFSEEGQ